MFVKLVILLVTAAFVVGMVAHTSHGAGPERVYVVKPSDTLGRSLPARTQATRARVSGRCRAERSALGDAHPGEKLILP